MSGKLVIKLAIRFGNKCFGLTRTGTIFEVSETILNNLSHLKTNVGTLQMFCVSDTIHYVSVNMIFRLTRPLI